VTLREQNLERLVTQSFDVLVIGGGINGAVSAAALSAHGASVALVECRDFAGFTSQHSSNLVWGGIKYMENYEFGLVAGLCKSRNELMRCFPSTVKEVRFLTTLSRGFRHNRFMLWAGTWLYWLFGRGFTRFPTLLSASRIHETEPVVNVVDSRGGVEYSDACLHDNDARFVWNFVHSAIRSGCVAVNYVEALAARQRANGQWEVLARDGESGTELQIRSRVIVNACGAFVDGFNEKSGVQTLFRHVLSKGIHLVVPRITDSKRVLAFFADDGRLFFAIPMANRTCIGTTDSRVSGPFSEVTDEDRNFVLSNINSRLNLATPLTPQDIIAERCGVRPLAVARGSDSSTDFLHLSRRHVVETSAENAYISVFGGKLTDCLNVGEEICRAVEKLGTVLSPPKSRWYGEPGAKEKQRYQRRARELGLNEVIAVDTRESLATRLWRRYGNDAHSILDRIEADATLAGRAIEEAGVCLAEVPYLRDNEMIVTLEDYLRRRSKLELLKTHSELRASHGLRQVCKILFGKDSNRRWSEYFSQQPASTGSQ
jgi:glycerol-3-phosphate dehydrogenase